MKRYSEMTREEIQLEMQRLREEGMKKHQSGLLSESELQVLEQKFYLAKSYLVDPKTIVIHGEYRVEGQEEDFCVDHLHGIMAWGNFVSSKEQIAIPIGRLGQMIRRSSNEQK
ncbi:YfhH family protein [Fodinisporobacter ferrooxydans]|uniref:YfhH family protein n=1 Tax=Fodinisporobacter ferrooxydans TaxID=2901836 RepID=A0ABY4CPZ8_9BACL|nr:YfhH family protein [Alicyclobacillaceae bacterium MYW30-H2]